MSDDQPTLFPNPETAEGAKPPVDPSGNPFDPTKHQASADGTPLRKKDGSWIPKGGRPKGIPQPKPEAAPKPPQAEFDPISESLPPAIPKTAPEAAEGPQEGPAAAPPPNPAGSAQNRATAITLSALAERLTIGLLGPDLTQTQEERDEVVAGWTVWLDSRGGINLSPGWALVACYGGIVASRMERPGVQQRVAGLYHRVRSWLGLNK